MKKKISMEYLGLCFYLKQVIDQMDYVFEWEKESTTSSFNFSSL